MSAVPLPLLENDRSIFRAMSFPNRVQNGRVHYRAFRLRPANAQWPEEDSLSVGTTVEGAKSGLSATYGVAELSVADVTSLGHGLEVRAALDAEKAAIWGIPSDSIALDLALTIAKDLAFLANLKPLILD
jgi:hypothetical protein